MAKQSRRRKGEKKSHPRGGGFGFNKSKQIKEIEGSIPRHEILKRSALNIDHKDNEEVFIVSGKTSDQQPRLATFNQLSSVSVTDLTANTAVLEDIDVEEVGDLGFFIDSEPASVTVNETLALEMPELSNVNQPEKAASTYEQKKKKVLQDDSVYIGSDEEDDLLDDGISISSSEDIEMLQALSHWGNSDIMQFNQPVKSTTDGDDYAMLRSATLDDICDSDVEINDEEDNILLDPSLDFDDLEHVPESMKNSYRGIIEQEKSRLKRQVKNQRKQKQRPKNIEINQKNSGKNRSQKSNILDQVLHEFIRKDHIHMYQLTNLTYHGRTMVVPKIAKLFQLEMSEIESNKKNIQLVKTSKTCIPLSYKQLIEKEERIVSKLKKTPMNKPARSRNREDSKYNALHGKEVASDSVPISSNNIGHRMLAAMGWKQGDAIGSKEDGIKEPVKVFMRANRRGLGA